ncbi:MAG: NAD(P)/FAD-dependent oxidoreductase, partial [Candidatus Binatia bacterium]
GLVAAALLQREHEITVFEAADYVGGHTNTLTVERFGRSWTVDTGFIVFNERTYPNFIRLLARYGVPSHPTTMSFSVRCERSGLEYNGTDLNRLFAQRRNLLRPSFYRMVADILRFYREAPALLEGDDDRLTLGRYLAREGYSPQFVEQHILPMGGAVWSTDPRQMLEFPARYLVQFFANHGFLTVDDRPRWRVVSGGSQQYVGPLTRAFRDRIRLRSPVRRIVRSRDGVRLSAAGAETERFDSVVIASHSDQALALLADPSPRERELLGAIHYQRNETVLHTDARLLPRRRRAWAGWNYHIPDGGAAAVTVTYNMNLLQGFTSPEPFCVTLNRSEAIDPAKVLARLTYDHPVYTPASVAAQRRWAEINGHNRTYFCGAYWGYGFHEDGVNSGLAVARCFGQGLDGPLDGIEQPVGVASAA